MRMQDICGYRIAKLTFVKHNRPNTVIRGQSKEEMLFDIYIYIYIYIYIGLEVNLIKTSTKNVVLIYC